MQVAVGTRKGQHELSLPVKLALTAAVICILGSLIVTNAMAVLKPARQAIFDHSGPGLEQTAGTQRFDLSNAAPGATQTKDTTIIYRGRGLAEIRLFAGVSGTGLDEYLQVSIESGSGAGSSFIPASRIFDGRLSEMPSSFARGIVDPQILGHGESRTYRISVTLVDDDAAQGLGANATFSWGAAA